MEGVHTRCEPTESAFQRTNRYARIVIKIAALIDAYLTNGSGVTSGCRSVWLSAVSMAIGRTMK